MSAELNRRDFLSLCSVLAASLTACAGAVQSRRVAPMFLSDPSIDHYRPSLRALIATVLPPGDAGFPLGIEEVERRLLGMFPLEQEQRFLPFQRALVYFDRLDLAPHVAEPLVVAERVALDVPARLSDRDFRTRCASNVTADSQRCERFFEIFGRAGTFSSLDAPARREWLRLWSESEFTVKRHFVHTARILIQVASYSSDAVWAAIGYDGPLLKQRELKT